MFIKIGEKGILLNADKISAITPFEETVENEKTGTEITHYGVKLDGSLEPHHRHFFFDDEESRDEFMSSVVDSDLLAKLGNNAPTASTERKTPAKTAKTGKR